jgi:hypothetical protein
MVKKQRQIMEKNIINGNGDLAGRRRLTARKATCYLLARGARFRKTLIILPRGTPVDCGETRKGKNGRVTTQLVVTGFIVLPMKRKLWVKTDDLMSIQ